jgi:butyryl-CoA dehydrogenase
MTTMTLTDERRALKEVAARLAADHYAPRAQEWDRDRTPLPHEEVRRQAELGLLGMCLPEEYDGGGRPLYDSLIVLEELAKASIVAGWPVFESNVGPVRVIDLFGTEEQKQAFLPPVCTGEKMIAVSISEPDAGSAATDVSVRARVEGGEVVLDGVKRWCSGAGHAEQYLVYARMSDKPGAGGVGAVLVDRDVAGLSFGVQEQLMGFRGVPSADMFFDSVRVPAEHVIIPAGGFKQLFTAFSIERLGNSTNSLACAQAALDRVTTYVQERKQFGKPNIDFQLVQASLADMVIEVEAARLLIRRAAESAGTGAPPALVASVAKCFANEMAKRVTDRAIQLLGGYGYSAEYDVERYHRDAHGWALAGGTPNIQRVRIASEYLGRRFDQRA